MSKIVLAEQSSAPDTPGAGKVAIYVDTDGSLCWRKDDGTIAKIASAGTYSLTIPATGTAALLGTAQTFTAAQTFSSVLTAPGMKPASDSTTAVQIQNAAGTAIITVDTSNNLVDLHRHQIVPITATAKATSSTYDMTVTIPSATTRLFCEFRGWILDNNSASSMTAARFTFRIIKASSGSATFAAIGEFEKIAPVSGVAISGVTVQSTSDTTVVIRVTMDGTSVGSLLVGGTLLVSGGTNRVTAAAFA